MVQTPWAILRNRQKKTRTVIRFLSKARCFHFLPTVVSSPPSLVIGRSKFADRLNISHGPPGYLSIIGPQNRPPVSGCVKRESASSGSGRRAANYPLEIRPGRFTFLFCGQRGKDPPVQSWSSIAAKGSPASGIEARHPLEREPADWHWLPWP
ncbi:Hypothetical protein NTJ_01192 [Nesidiocoris tenuis]|uniref:Uncharacterized protein n=1 Tax=Nesidiocoris tenuis TaxID=355587 RepID=A0ABN7A7X7_9HEMI|nr:Hypothetical protein NTJ_01192 [Nesidiocoris tenuis]